MATDDVTSPMSKNGMLVYGVGIGILTTVIRLFGSYPEGMSFAILIMNAFTPVSYTHLGSELSFDTALSESRSNQDTIHVLQLFSRIGFSQFFRMEQMKIQFAVVVDSSLQQ